jgi:iron complex transport system ATP-binding protein
MSNSNAPDSPAAVIEVRNGSFSYGETPALRNVSFQVARGDFVGIVGPNGSGKSTLLKIVDGILTPQKGESLLLGKPVRSYGRKYLAREVALVPQSFTLDFDFAVHEVVDMGRYARKGLETHGLSTDELLEKLEIDALKDRRFPELSGGEKQMVVLAQALAQEPSLLLLDEPAAHLDVSYQLRLFDWLKKLNNEGLTIVCVLHDLNLALLYFESMLVFSEGKLFASGPTEEVLTPETIEAVYGVHAYLHRHAGRTFLTFSPRSRPTRKEKVHLLCGGGTGAHLMRELVDLGYSVSVGVVNAMDTDEVTARELGLPIAAEAPFTPITDEAYRENMSLVEKADLVLLTDVPLGAGNIRNLDSLREAAVMGKDVWVLDGVAERDFTGLATGILEGLVDVRYLRDTQTMLVDLGERV